MTFAESLRNAGTMDKSRKGTDRWLIADIGATNARCAILTAGEPEPEQLNTFLAADHDSLESLLGNYLDDTNERPEHALLAVAAPIHGDSVQMINLDWSFSTSSIATDLGLQNVKLLNDYHAVAYALPALRNDQLHEIGNPSRRLSGNRAVLGPGSGLGMAAWIGDEQSGSAMTGEGGHITLSARNEREDEIIRRFRERYGHCSAERVLSGPGIAALHHAMHGEVAATPEAITANTTDPLCVATMNQFFDFLGSAAAELALITGSFGGLYIAGGIVPACLEQMKASRFRDRFEDKNRYQDYMQAIPTFVITDSVPGLTGLAAYLKNETH